MILDDPRPDEAIASTAAVGLCHTDLSVRSGVLPMAIPSCSATRAWVSWRQERAVPLGDHVLLSFTSCGMCPECDQGCPAYCLCWILGGTRSGGSGTLSTGEGPVTGHFFGQLSFSSAPACTREVW